MNQKTTQWPKIIICNSIGMITCVLAVIWAINERPRVDPVAICLVGLLAYCIPTGLAFMCIRMVSAPELKERVTKASIYAGSMATVAGIGIGAKSGFLGGVIATAAIFPIAIFVQLMIISTQKQYQPKPEPISAEEDEKITRQAKFLATVIWSIAGVLVVAFVIFFIVTAAIRSSE